MVKPDDIFQLDAICNQFEQAWKQSPTPPELNGFRDNADESHRPTLFKLLLPIDVEYRKRGSLACDSGQYAKQFPQYASLISEIVDSVDTVSVEQDPSVDDEQDFSVGLDATKDFDSSAPPTSAVVSPRKQIGRYTILQQLGEGEGGMGAVYRAAHPTLPIEVAIKVSLNQLSEGQRRAIHDEAHVLCELDHPNIARIRDLDFDRNGCPILVLDLVRGRSLSQLLRSGNVPLKKAVCWLAGAAEGVDYAHRRGVLHLDLKPANIVIDDAGNAKVIDFGLARIDGFWSEPNDDDRRICGTPQYMPPEQSRGLTSEITSKADIFGLGAILYEILTGKKPFAAESPQQAIMRSMRYDVDLASLENASAPRELIESCQKAIACDPALRFASAKEFADAIQAAVAPKPEPLPVKNASGSTSQWIATAIGLATIFVLASLVVPSLKKDENKAAIAQAAVFPSAVPSEIASPNHLINEFTITHIAMEEDKQKGRANLLDLRQPREDDNVKIQATFKQPVYCFLFALNPDGVLQPCYPMPKDIDVVQQQPLTSLVYPPDDDAVTPNAISAFGLTDGSGEQAFVLIASQEPLPSFSKWKTALDSVSWPDSDVQGNWLYQHGEIEPLGNDQRGDIRETRGDIRRVTIPGPFKRLCDSLRAPDAVDVQGVVFEVVPR